MIIDFHAHVLPRCDHGCDHSAMAKNQLLMMRAAGTDAVVATPHFYPNNDRVESFLDGRDGAIEAMHRKLPLEDLPIVYPAAEVLVCPGLHEMEGLESLTVSGTNVILLEIDVDFHITIRRGFRGYIGHIIHAIDGLLQRLDISFV